MRIIEVDRTYDPDSDSAYITMMADTTIKVARTLRVQGDDNILLDFDEAGHLIGIDILNASLYLTNL